MEENTMDKQEAKRMFAKSSMVIVSKMRISEKSKCQNNKCKKDDAYCIFVGSEPRLSTLSYNCCGGHLQSFVDKAIEDAKKYRKGAFSQWCKEQKQKAREIVKS